MNKFLFSIAVLAAVLAGGCQNTRQAPLPVGAEESEIVLQAGDTVKVTFPGAPNLDSAPQAIRRDGKITLPIAGEVPASGLTPTQLQDKLLTMFGPQLVTKEVQVSVAGSAFSVYIDGPVMHPGKITTDHPLSVLEAIMEAGGFDYTRADTKHVQIIRHENRSRIYSYYTVNLHDVMGGRRRDLFYLAPGDIVHVTEKFSLF